MLVDLQMLEGGYLEIDWLQKENMSASKPVQEHTINTSQRLPSFTVTILEV